MQVTERDMCFFLCQSLWKAANGFLQLCEGSEGMEGNASLPSSHVEDYGEAFRFRGTPVTTFASLEKWESFPLCSDSKVGT